ncbi:MAG: S8 family serine peptidase [Solirubrobacterales bacterium]
MLGISSRGPTPGGRKKPDLTAPGGAVVSADSAWDSPPSNPDYTAETGTSFSSPHVAGAMTLLEGAGITDPMAQRALLINSARDWNGTNTGLHGWTAPQTGWRPEVGWGELDLTTALAQRSYYRLGSVPEGEAAFYRATVPAGSKATMAFQLRGYFVGYPDPGTQTLKYTQSNLDLHQYDASDAEVAPPAAFDPPDTSIDPGPDAIDPNDTVEQVRSPGSPGSQQITYKVQSASTIDGASAEPFAIATAGPLTPLASPTVRPNSLGASAGTVPCGQPVVITTTARNDSPDLTAGNAALGIDLPSGVSLTSGSATQVVSGGTLGTAATSESHAWTVQATSEGVKTITVRGAGDAYGTTFRDADQVSFTADCTPPSTAIDTGPSGPTSDPSPSFGFSAQGGGGGFECSLDAGSFAPCSSPYEAPTQADGAHTFRVRAIDGVGNIDPVPATRAFIVDTVPPDTAITSGPSGAVRSTSATFGLSGGSTYACSLDGSGFSSCDSVTTFAGLGNGSHVLLARALDEAGNADPVPASRSFVVDTKVTGAELRLKKTQRFGGKFAAKVKVRLGEPGNVSAVAKGKAGARSVTLKSDRISLGEGGKTTLTLVAKRRAVTEISRVLEDGIVKLPVAVTYRDELGNSKALRSRLKLRPSGGGHR